jgi:hypothetical protein
MIVVLSAVLLVIFLLQNMKKFSAEERVKLWSSDKETREKLRKAKKAR